MELNDLLQRVLPLAKEAGTIIRRNWDKPGAIHHKGLIDLVTETDVAVEAFLKPGLMGLAPDAIFVGEETANLDDASILQNLCWVVDPIDGTTNFVHRIPMVSTSIALCQGGRPILGVVYAPILEECFYATADSPAYCNGRMIHVSQVADIQQSLVVTGFPYSMEGRLSGILRRLERVLPATQGLRRLGSAAIDLAWVAAGKLEAFYEDGLKPWDMAAGWLLVEQAGGIVTDFNGQAPAFLNSLVATNGKIHANMVKLIRD